MRLGDVNHREGLCPSCTFDHMEPALMGRDRKKGGLYMDREMDRSYETTLSYNSKYAK